MDDRFAWLHKLQEGTQRLMEDSPLKDVERNAQVWFDAAFEQAMGRLKLVQRREYETLSSVVEKMAIHIEALEQRIKILESAQHNTPSPSPSQASHHDQSPSRSQKPLKSKPRKRKTAAQSTPHQ